MKLITYLFNFLFGEIMKNLFWFIWALISYFGLIFLMTIFLDLDIKYSLFISFFLAALFAKIDTDKVEVLNRINELEEKLNLKNHANTTEKT